MRAETKAMQEAGKRFYTLVTEYLTSLGAKPSDFYAFTVETKAGLLFVSPYESHVNCRFKDVEAAKALLGTHDWLNLYTGKWNHHFEVRTDVEADEAFDHFKRTFARVLP